MARKCNVTKFRIYPERGVRFRRFWFSKYFKINTNLFFRVLVFENRKDLVGYYDECEPGVDHAKVTAAVFSRDEVTDLPNCIGKIIFCKCHLTTGVLAHELTHATMYWLREKGIKTVIYGRKSKRIDHIRQEMAADGCETMNAQFNGSCFRKKISVRCSIDRD